MSSIVIAIERSDDGCKSFEDMMVSQLSRILEDLNYKLIAEIDERGDIACCMNDRRLRFRPRMIGEQP